MYWRRWVIFDDTEGEYASSATTATTTNNTWTIMFIMTVTTTVIIITIFVIHCIRNALHVKLKTARCSVGPSKTLTCFHLRSSWLWVAFVFSHVSVVPDSMTEQWVNLEYESEKAEGCLSDYKQFHIGYSWFNLTLKRQSVKTTLLNTIFFLREEVEVVELEM